MKTNLRGRDFISTQEWTREELETVLRLAFDLKMKWGLDLPTRLLKDKTLFMLFFFSSTRTRNSFEAGMRQNPFLLWARHCHPPLRLGRWQQIHPRRRRACANPRHQYAM